MKPFLYLDRAGYEYASMNPGDVYPCSGCGTEFQAVAGESARAHVHYPGPHGSPRPEPETAGVLGFVCDAVCAGRAYERYLSERGLSVNRGRPIDEYTCTYCLGDGRICKGKH